jgi:RNA polymerase sigma factor (sigma-70 family)
VSCDIKDFKDFFRVEFPRLVKFLLTAGFGVEEAQDAAAEAMVDLYLRWAHVGNVTAYVRAAALHSATNQARRDRERVTRSIRGGWVVPELVDPFGSVDERLDAGRQLLELVRCLPYQQRVVLAWHLDGFKNTEIADHFEMNPATVGSNLRHAKQRLREMLEIQRRAKGDDERRDPA